MVEFEFLSGRRVSFPEKILVDEDFHISHVIENVEETGPILILEDEEASLSIFYSIQFRKFIRYKFCCLELIKALAEKWVVKKWLQLEIENKLNSCDPENIKKCTICEVFYKSSQNYLNSCRFHPMNYNVILKTFICCGVSKSPGCREGYHG